MSRLFVIVDSRNDEDGVITKLLVLKEILGEEDAQMLERFEMLHHHRDGVNWNDLEYDKELFEWLGLSTEEEDDRDASECFTEADLGKLQTHISHIYFVHLRNVF